MALYVINVDPPLPGFDWSYTIPGQYLEHIVGVTAQLTTVNAAAGAMVDASGNGNDGTYGKFGDTTNLAFVSGLIPGNDAIQAGNNALVGQTDILTDPFANSFTIAFWFRQDAGGSAPVYLLAREPPFETIGLRGDATGSGSLMTLRIQQDGIHDNALSSDGVDLGLTAHFLACTYDHPAGTARFYLDGALLNVETTFTFPVTRVTSFFEIGFMGANETQTFDEYAIFAAELSAGDIAGLYTAGISGFDTYRAAVAALNPFVYYHLDTQPPGGGREAVFEVTDGTHVVGRYDSGFAAISSGGFFLWSWQPQLNAATELA